MKFAALIFAMAITPIFAQTQSSKGANSPNIANVKGDVNIPAVSQPSPTFSTSDQIALKECETQKKDATAQFNTALQQELTILREWQADHPGWHVYFNPQNPSDPKNFSIEADAKPEAKPKTPPASEKK